MDRTYPTVVKMKPAVQRLALIAATMVLIGSMSLGLCGPAAASARPDSSGSSDFQVPAPPPWPHETSDLAADPAIVFGRLGNGFRYALMENDRPSDRVSLHLFVGAGSLNETDAQRGVAHFLEHMLFNGSTHFPPGELIRYFQGIGMQFGNDANAHTGFDETVYDIILPSGDRASLEKGLLVIHDYATGALLLDSEIDRERKVILSEMRARDSAGYRTFTATLGFELPDLLVSRRMPIGTTDVIQGADRALLKSYYDAWYRPENMVLVMVGDFSAPLAASLIENRFERLTARSAVPDLPPLGTIAHRGIEPFYHHEPEAGGTTVGIEAISEHTPTPDSLARLRQRAVEQMADRIVQHRLDAQLKKTEAPFTSAAVGSGVYLNRIRYAEITADSSADNWQPTLATIERELRRAEKYGFTEAELERVRKETLKELDKEVKEAATRDSTALARALVRDLAADRVSLSPEQERAALAPVVAAVGAAEVHRAFQNNWPDTHRLVLVTGDADLKASSSTLPTDLIRDTYLAAADSVVERPESTIAAAFPYLPEPTDLGGMAARETIEDLGITRIRLNNGIHINLKPTDYKANEILAQLIFGYGTSSEPRSLPGISLLAEATVNESGLGRMDTHEIEQALAGKSTYADFRITDTHFGFYAESVSAEVALLFQLIRAHLIDPGFRDDALALSRERLRQDYQSFTRSTDGMMRVEGLRLLAGGDSRFGMPPFEKIDAIGLADIRDWIAPQLESAPLELSIVGDFDVEAVVDLARRYLGTLPDRDPKVDNPRADLPKMPSGAIHRLAVDSQIPKALVVSAWPTEDFWDIHRSRRMSVLADVFSDRLRQRIREKLGASYSPYAFNQASRAYSGYGVFQAYVNVAPEQAQAVLAEVRAIAGDLAGNGVTDDELSRSVDPILTSIKSLQQTNGYWLNSVMTGATRHPQQLEWARTFLADYAAVTVAELDTLAATYLSEERSSAIIIAPASAAQGLRSTVDLSTCPTCPDELRPL
jgi:zinc protease